MRSEVSANIKVSSKKEERHDFRNPIESRYCRLDALQTRPGKSISKYRGITDTYQKSPALEAADRDD